MVMAMVLDSSKEESRHYDRCPVQVEGHGFQSTGAEMLPVITLESFLPLAVPRGQESRLIPCFGVVLLPLSSSITVKHVCWCQAILPFCFLLPLCPADLEGSCNFLVVITGPALSGIYTLTCPSRFPSKQVACHVSSGFNLISIFTEKVERNWDRYYVFVLKQH